MSVVGSLWDLFRSGKTRTREWRAAQLRGVVAMLDAHEADFLDSLRQDLGKCAFEAATLEVVVTRCEAQAMAGQLGTLMADERVSTPGLLAPGTSFIRREPLGVCLIIGPFNYPLQLVLAPLLGALAAGNCAVISPSEKSPATAALLARYLPVYCEGVAVVEGDATVSAELATRRWGKIFFTGSTRVGRQIARAAAETLTPVCLELGGKTPVIVHRSADIDVAARRIAWGKTVNCGQTCIAPDFVVVERAVAQRLVDALKRALGNFYGNDAAASADYGRMIDGAAVARMRALLADHGGAIVAGGRTDDARCFVEPTLILKPRETSRLMSEEIFGPLLPILVVDSAADALALVARRCADDAPLSLYVFSADRAFADAAVRAIPSGSVLVNDVLLHFGNPNLPFGGVGSSGQGNYHGASSFRCFSHERAVLERSSHRLLEIERMVRYPPYTSWHIFGVTLFLQRLPQIPTRPLRKLALLAAVLALVLALRARGSTVALTAQSCLHSLATVHARP